jgi:hypothetical protein
MDILNNETDKIASNRILGELDEVLECNKCSIAETICFCEIIKFKAIIQISNSKYIDKKISESYKS